MAIINITVTESALQLVAGVPKSVTIETDIPSTIFYTLDNSVPTINSMVYIGTINLPTRSQVILKIFASNGTDNSEIVIKTYQTDPTNLRRPRDKVEQNDFSTKSSFPFSSNTLNSPPVYGVTGGIIVDAAEIPNYPDGYDGTATGTAPGGTDLPLDSYDRIYSTRNQIGESGPGIGTLPAKVALRIAPPPQEESNVNDQFFDPKALVIYQDDSVDSDIPIINKQYFLLEDANKRRNGALLYATALDGGAPSGTFLRSFFNPKENTVTYYYFDGKAICWIVSKQKAQGAESKLYMVPISAKVGLRVYPWYRWGARRGV